MEPDLDRLAGALPPDEARAFREAAPADLVAAVRWLAEGPEDSFVAALRSLGPEALATLAGRILDEAPDEPMTARIAALPELAPALPALARRARGAALDAVLGALPAVTTPAAAASAAEALRSLKPSRAVKQAVRDLAWTGERPLFPLFEALLAEKSAELRRAGLDGLARGARAEDAALLRKAVEAELGALEGKSSRLVAPDAYDPLERAFDRLHEIGAGPDAALARATLALGVNEPGERLVASLDRHERRDLLPLLEETLKHKGEEIRRRAVAAVARLGGEAERLRLLERFLTSARTHLGPTFAAAFADQGFVDTIPLLEVFESGTERRFTVYGDAIARLEQVRHLHGLVSRDHVRGRLGQFEDELRSSWPPGHEDLARGPVLLRLLAELGDREGFDALVARLVRDQRVEVRRLADQAPHPFFLPALRKEGPPDPYRRRLLARCGDPSELEADLAEGPSVRGWRMADLALLPSERRLDAWRRLYPRVAPDDRAEAIDAAAPVCPELREALLAIAADASEFAHPRNRAAWHASRPAPARAERPPLVRFPAEAVERLRKKAAAKA